MKKIFVLGSLNVDYTIKIDRLPLKGETITGGEFFKSYGGKGANQAVGAKKFGAEVMFLGCVGNDEDGRDALENLKNHGVDVKLVNISDKAPTGKAFIFVDSQGNNMIAVAPGANRHLLPDIVKRARGEIESSDLIMSQLEIPEESVLEAFSIAKKKKIPTLLNPAPPKNLSDELLELCDFFTPNLREAEFYSGITIKDEKSVRIAVMEMVKRGLRNIIVTLGERGCYYFIDGKENFVDTFKVKSIDSTAAGDAFNSAFAVMIAEKKNIDMALKFANAAGALTTTRMGAMSSIPQREEVEELLKRQKSE